MAFKLYGLPMSTNTTRAMICLHEKEVDFELVPVNVFAAEHKQPPFLSKNVSACSIFLFSIRNLSHSHTNFILCCTRSPLVWFHYWKMVISLFLVCFHSSFSVGIYYYFFTIFHSAWDPFYSEKTYYKCKFDLSSMKKLSYSPRLS